MQVIRTAMRILLNSERFAGNLCALEELKSQEAVDHLHVKRAPRSAKLFVRAVTALVSNAARLQAKPNKNRRAVEREAS